MLASWRADRGPKVDWDKLRIFHAVADKGSLTHAGEVLHLSQSAVSRQIRALEESLNVTLFHRHARGLILTEQGELLFDATQQMAKRLDATAARIRDSEDEVFGELRVTTNDTLLVHMLTPIFASFRAAYPEIRLDVVISNQSLSLSKRDADVAIRASDRPGDTLVGRRMASIAWGIYGSAAQNIAGPLDPADLRRYDWIGFSDNLGAIKPAKWLRERVGEEKIIYRVNTVLGLAEAAAAGMGLALLPCFIAAVTPGLVQLMGRQGELEAGLWLLTHPDIKATARVRTFMEHAGREIGKLRGRIEGIEDQPAAAAG